MAFGTKATFLKAAGWIGTESGDRTVTPVGTVIERASKAAGLLEKHMVADFLGNSSTIPSQSPADLLKGSRSIKQGFDSKTFFKR